MVWSPINITANCKSELLMFIVILIQYLGESDDDNISRVRNNKGVDSKIDNKYDFIIVGAGSAGCVVANRLSEIKSWKILLLEVGDEEPGITAIPGLWPLSLDSNIDHGYYTQSEPAICRANNGSCHLAAGKVMGGSSSINSMMYVRGNKQDYDDWSKLGNVGWSYKDVLPYFKKSMLSAESDSRSASGYLAIDELPDHDENVDTIISAWKELGYEETDYMTGSQIGVSRIKFTAFNGTRQSTNHAFIKPIRGKRANLSVRSKAQVTRILIDKRTKKALGVEYVCLKTKMTFRAYAEKETIVSAGAVQSPKLLMLSGIGPAEHLKEAKIDLIRDLPVGQNLQDHTVVLPSAFDLKHGFQGNKNIQDMKSDLLQWMGTRRGPLSNTGLQRTVTFLQTSLEKRPGLPDIQVGFVGTVSEKNKCSVAFSRVSESYYDQARPFISLITSKSRGSVKLNRSDPITSHPIINLNSLSDPTDIQRITEGIKIIEKFAYTKAFKKKGFTFRWNDGCETFKPNTKAHYECLISYYSFTSFHAVGTCKMGPGHDTEAVVDFRLKVHGIDRLRIIDGSIMPEITRGNTNAPIIMIAEKGSDLIKADWL